MTDRIVAVFCPRWAVVCAQVEPEVAAVVIRANRVITASAAAAAQGVRTSMRKREAQALCPDLVVISDDPVAQMRCFEQVLQVVESFVPIVEVLRPGACVFGAKGPSRYFGGEVQLVAKLTSALRGLDIFDGAHPSVLPRIGIAPGHFAASLAAQRNMIVEDAREFLKPLPIESLAVLNLVSTLKRLGIRTLGELAALPRDKVVARFGSQGAWAHDAASGVGDRILAPRDAPPDLSVRYELEVVAASIDQATFAAKAAADELIDKLIARGLACMRLDIEIQTEHGETHERSWRYSGPFTAIAIAERGRWQLEGWLQRDTPGAVEVITLRPQDVVNDTGSQEALWGRGKDVDDRVRRSLDRVQGLLGHTGVVRAFSKGGRTPGQQSLLIAWGDPFFVEKPRAPVRVELPTWPGQIPSPLPTLACAYQVWVTDNAGQPVVVTKLSELSSVPHMVKVGGSRQSKVKAWSAVWPSDEHFWDRAFRKRVSRLQVVLEDSTAWLVSFSHGKWTAESQWN